MIIRNFQGFEFEQLEGLQLRMLKRVMLMLFLKLIMKKRLL